MRANRVQRPDSSSSVTRALTYSDKPCGNTWVGEQTGQQPLRFNDSRNAAWCWHRSLLRTFNSKGAEQKLGLLKGRSIFILSPLCFLSCFSSSISIFLSETWVWAGGFGVCCKSLHCHSGNEQKASPILLALTESSLTANQSFCHLGSQRRARIVVKWLTAFIYKRPKHCGRHPQRTSINEASSSWFSSFT